MLNVALEERVEKVEEEHVKAKYDWRYENSINQKKKYYKVEGILEFKYDPYRTNSMLSNFPDTVINANEMNINYHLDHQLQYDYLYYSVRAKNRFFKKDKHKKDDDFTLIQQFYKYNNERTKEALKVLSPEQIAEIRKLKKGG